MLPGLILVTCTQECSVFLDSHYTTKYILRLYCLSCTVIKQSDHNIVTKNNIITHKIAIGNKKIYLGTE